MEFLCSLIPDRSGYKWFHGIFYFPWPGSYKVLLKQMRCTHRVKWYLKEIKSLGKGVEGKSRPWGSDPVCCRHSKGHQQGQEPEPQPPRGQAVLPAQVQISAGRFCVHTNDLIHALNEAGDFLCLWRYWQHLLPGWSPRYSLILDAIQKHQG